MIKHICSNCNWELIVGNMAIECDNCRAVIYTYPGVYMHVKVDMPPPKAKLHEEVALLHKQTKRAIEAAIRNSPAADE